MAETKNRIPDDLSRGVVGHRPATLHTKDRTAGVPEVPLVTAPMSLLAGPTDGVHRLVFEQNQRVRTAIGNPLLDQDPLQIPGGSIVKLIITEQHPGALHDMLHTHLSVSGAQLTEPLAR